MGKHCAATLARGDGTDNLDMEQKPLASIREPTSTELPIEVSGGGGLSSHDRRLRLGTNRPLAFKCRFARGRTKSCSSRNAGR